MLLLLNSGIKDILHREQRIVVYGASVHLESMLEYYRKEKIGEKIAFIVDKDEKKNGNVYDVLNYSFNIVALNKFIHYEDIPKHYQILIVIEKYTEVLKELDSISSLNGMFCSIWWVPYLSCHSGKSLDERIDLPKVERLPEIPKIIHYCWFGGGRFPESTKKCIESWKRTNPDFEIKEWNEKNFDVNKLPYIREAYKAGKYSFVSDYARYEIILNNGGFYFDTDVELLRDISIFCKFRGFFSFEFFDLINSGSGFAANRGDPLIDELCNQYKERKFINWDGTLNEMPCSKYETDFFKRRGIRDDNTFQKIEGILILPYDFFSPLNQATAALELTVNTYGIHRFDCSWLEGNAKAMWIERKSKLMSENERLIKGWRQVNRLGI